MNLIDKLIERAKRTPYFHLEGYMERYWLAKPNPKRWFFKDFAVRIHRILRYEYTEFCVRIPINVSTITHGRQCLLFCGVGIGN